MLDPDFFRQAAPAAVLVTQMAVVTIGGLLLGSTLDGYLDSAPGFLISGVSGGFALGLFNLKRGLERLQTSHDDDSSDHP